jgi:hypothetical protein
VRRVRVGFSKAKAPTGKPLSFLIRKVTGRPYSHAFLRWRTGDGQWLCYHAAVSGLNFVGEEAYEKTIDLITEYETDLSEEQFREVLRYCVRKSGTSYSYLGLVGMVYVLLMRRLGVRAKNPFADGDRTSFCDELIIRLMQTVHKLDASLDPEASDPGDLEDEIKRDPDFRPAENL